MSTKKFLLLILCLHCNQQIVLSRVPHDNREENCDKNTNRVYMVSENLKSNSIHTILLNLCYQLILGNGSNGLFCNGVLIYSSYIVLPAHCLAAGKKLSNYRFKMKLKNEMIELQVEESFLVFPEFRIISYNQRNFLQNDIAIVVLKDDKRQRSLANRRHFKIGISSERSFKNFKEVNNFQCSSKIISNSQVCLQKQNIRKVLKNMNFNE